MDILVEETANKSIASLPISTHTLNKVIAPPAKLQPADEKKYQHHD